MRSAIAIAVLLTLGAAPRHRRFMQPNLPRAGTAVVPQPCPRTNSALYSESFDTGAVWQEDHSGGAAAPVVTADQAADPITGAMTADRIQFAGTSASQDSILFQKACPNGPAKSSGSVYVKGRTGSGTLDFCKLTSIAIPNCHDCAYTSTAWTRCTVTNHAVTLDQGYFYIGNASVFNGGAVRAANDVYVFGGDCEDGATVSAYIGPTLGVAVTRSCP